MASRGAIVTVEWDAIILNKTVELGRFLLEKSQSPDFTDPNPRLERNDNSEIRKRILELTQKQAQDLGIGRSTLYSLRKRARDHRSFEIYQKVWNMLG